MPTWDGKAPEKNLKSYLKALRFWRRDTVVPEHRQGVKLYKSLSTNGELRAAVDLLDEAVIMSPQGWEAIIKVVERTYGLYLEADAEITVHEAIFGTEKLKGESFLQYVSRKVTKLRELERVLGEMLPDKFKGAIVKRGAKLTEAQRSTLHTWVRGDLTMQVLVENMRRSGKPEDLAEVGKVFFEGESEEVDVFLTGDDSEGGELDFELDREYDEEEVQYILAYAQSYKDVRRDLADAKVNRGFKQGGKPAGKGGNSTGKGIRPRRTKEELLRRTRCFGCGEVGHMQRDCPRRSRGKGSSATLTTSSTSTTAPTFFCDGRSQASHSWAVEGIGQDMAVWMTVPAGEAIVDTGAQDGVCGVRAYDELKKRLADFGLKPPRKE